MIKKYKASTLFSITIIPEGGKRMHISFFGMTHGGSFYETSDEAVQKALESTRFFNNAYYLMETKAEEAEVKEEKTEAVASEKKQISVSGLQDAKEFLATQYGIMRTSLRTKAAILSAAEANNIEFVGL